LKKKNKRRALRREFDLTIRKKNNSKSNKKKIKKADFYK
jgi:hypothetical protein